MAKHKKPDPAVCRNRQAGFRYHILDTIECGIVLIGTEVKSLRSGAASLKEAYGRIDNGELWLIGFHIGPYDHASGVGHDPYRRRKLLVHARELSRLRPKIEQKGQTLVPIKVYFNERGIAKVTLALATGKSQHDKRQTLKSREHKRDMDRAMRRG